MSRLNPNKPREKDTRGVVLEIFGKGEDELCAGAMINSEVLNKQGYEVKASISRVNPESYDNQVYKSETSQYFHILNSANPFSYDRCGIGAHESIELCQKAFYSFPSFRNPILMQSYLSNTPIHFTGKDKKVIKFFEEWAQKVNIWDIANQFFLEWFRSGNVLVYRFDGEIKLAEIKKLATAGEKEAVAKARKIPLKYIIINPVDVRGIGSSVFSGQEYGKVLNPYEVEMLKNGISQHDKDIYDGLDEQSKKAITTGQQPVIRLEMERLRLAFNAKQSYEPMAVPPYFGVLKSINFKQILRSSEEKVAASADYCILLITAGDEKREGKKNRQLLEGMANLFSAQSVGRVLFADYSAKAQFVIPKLNEIFGNEKYVNVDKEILNGMNDIMGSDENFATGQTKTKIYLELLSQARESFIQYFLYPEMKHISEEMGFKETPTPRFEEVTLESLNESKKLYNRLYELGALTPKELFNAYETNQLPVEEESLENQKAFKTQKKEKIYEPLIGNKAEVGRPTGTTAPKSKNTISPQGKASLAKIKENMPKMQELANLVSSVYKEKNSIARLSQNHKKLVDSMWERIMSVETVDNWGKEVVSKYIENPLSLTCGGAQFDQICELMEEHELDLIAATILFHSMEKN
jgi:hypothetical protein